MLQSSPPVFPRAREQKVECISYANNDDDDAFERNCPTIIMSYAVRVQAVSGSALYPSSVSAHTDCFLLIFTSRRSLSLSLFALRLQFAEQGGGELNGRGSSSAPSQPLQATATGGYGLAQQFYGPISFGTPNYFCCGACDK